MKRHKVTFLPDELTIEVPEGSTLMDAMHQAGIYFDFPCGGGKKCGKCRVGIFQNHNRQVRTDVTIRLACLTKVKEDLTVEFLFPEKPQSQILSMALERSVRIRPHLRKQFVEVKSVSLAETHSDWTRVKESLVELDEKYLNLQTGISVLRQLPALLRNSRKGLTAVIYNGEMLGIEAGDTTDTMLGMAFDIGTTSIVGYLVDLRTGEQLHAVSSLNPQTQFGADVISRIMYADREDGLDKLHTVLIAAINALIGEAVDKAGVPRDSIYALSMVGNTTMQYLFLGINPYYVALAPYVSVVGDSLVVNATDVKLQINQAGCVFVLPNIAGFIGADTVAVLLATELHRSQDIKLVIDIGTNGEIVLGSAVKQVTCSTAAGPAFEGVQISCGMRGTVGAIEYIAFEDDLVITVIGRGKPRGICGSALLDVVAGLLEVGLIDRKGRFVSPEQQKNPSAQCYQHRLIRHDGTWAFLVAAGDDTDHGNPIIITQRDIRELQMAKGAIAAGIKILSQTYGIQVGDISEVLLAGAFGNYMNPHSACTLGMIPQELESRIKMIGNAAGAGAKLALLSASEFIRASTIATSVEYVELGLHPYFMKVYAESMYF